MQELLSGFKGARTLPRNQTYHLGLYQETQTSKCTVNTCLIKQTKEKILICKGYLRDCNKQPKAMTSR